MLQDLREFMVAFTQWVELLKELFPLNPETNRRELDFGVTGEVNIKDPQGNVWVFVKPDAEEPAP